MYSSKCSFKYSTYHALNQFLYYICFQAFGNAKTASNNNSSRFGKFTEVKFREDGTVSG